MMDLFNVATTDLLGFSLIFFRMSSLIITMPFFGGNQIKLQVRMAFVLALTFIMYVQTDTSLIVMPANVYEYALLIAKEMGVGIMLGFVASIAFFAVQLGGAIIAIQMGLSRSTGIDPLGESNVPTVGQILMLLAMTVFLVLNGHHFLLKVFFESFSQVPVSHIHYSQGLFMYVIKAFNQILVVGMRIAIPAMALMYVLMVALAFIARLVPQMNVFMLSMPVKIAGGFIITAITLPMVMVLFYDTFEQALETMYRTLTVL